jgi:hypothetical protein
MPNPGGGNQLGSYQIQPKYGDVKKQTALTKAAPISGAPYAAQALNTPQRSQRSATRGTPQQSPQQPPTVGTQSPTLPPEQIYKAIADLPGASDDVRAIFGG